MRTRAESTSGTSDSVIHVSEESAFIVKAAASHAARLRVRSRAKSTRASSNSGIQPAKTYVICESTWKR